MNKKGNTGLVIFLVVLFIIVIVVATVIIISGVKSNWWKHDKIPEELNITYTNIFLKGLNSDTKNSTELNYIIGFQSNGTYKFIAEGRTRTDDWTEIQVEESSIYEVWCYDNKNYYVGKVSYPMVLHPEDKNSNRSFITCSSPPMGDITVSHLGYINEGDNQVRVSISSEQHVARVSVCAEWTAGIINMYLPDQLVKCNEGSWLNWSSYNETTKEFTYYENNYYRCGEDYTERCESVNHNECKVFSMDIPLRYKGLVDSCWYTGNSLDNSTINMEFKIKAENLNQLDSIKLTIIDEDRRYDPIENRWVWYLEKDGVNIGIQEDTLYEIKYENF